MSSDELKILFHEQFSLKNTSLNENISFDGWQLDNNWEVERTANNEMILKNFVFIERCRRWSCSRHVATARIILLHCMAESTISFSLPC